MLGKILEVKSFVCGLWKFWKEDPLKDISENHTIILS